MKTIDDIPRYRLYSQHLATHTIADPALLVQYMGAIQAQDPSMAKWALGVRLPGCVQTDIDKAMDEGRILRTHVLRPTWHLVAAADIHWMLALAAPQIQPLLRSRTRQLSLTDQLLSKSLNIITRSLEGGQHQTREQLVTRLSQAGIPTDEYRAAHIMMHAELEGLVCSGRMQKNTPTYALLHERVAEAGRKDREAALATLAHRYFTSHGPATLPDFSWWSGLTLKDAQRAIAAQESRLESVLIEGQTYWFSSEQSFPPSSLKSLLLLPAFDEFLISYKDRSASLPLQHRARAVSNNGIFRPVVVLNGQVIGLWKRSVKKAILSIDLENVPAFSVGQQRMLQAATEQLGAFSGRQAVVNS